MSVEEVCRKYSTDIVQVSCSLKINVSVNVEQSVSINVPVKTPVFN